RMHTGCQMNRCGGSPGRALALARRRADSESGARAGARAARGARLAPGSRLAAEALLALREHALDRIDDRDGARVELDVDAIADALAGELGEAQRLRDEVELEAAGGVYLADGEARAVDGDEALGEDVDRKSTRLNS